MDSSSFWALKIFFGGVSAFFGLLAALFFFLGAAAQKYKLDRINAWCTRKWQKLSTSAWPKLPENIIRSFLDSRDRLFVEKRFDWFIASTIIMQMALALSIWHDVAPRLYGGLPGSMLIASVLLTVHIMIRVLRTSKSVGLLVFGTFTSFLITAIALSTGAIDSESSPVLEEHFLLGSNAVMDGLTIFVTFAILSWVIEHPGFLKIPLAILADLTLAALFALLSLYLGLVFSVDSLTFNEVFNALIARSMDGSRFEIGPFFLVMHTTFIPTLIYLFLIFAAWVAKGFVLPLANLLKTFGINANPLQLTARLCVVFVALFGLFSYLADAGMQHAERQLKQQLHKPQQEPTAKP